MRACSHSHPQPVGVATFDPPTPRETEELNEGLEDTHLRVGLFSHALKRSVSREE